MKKKPSNVPVYLIYAGIIHVIGLALLLPMLITLPGPGREAASPSSAIDVDIVSTAPAETDLEADNAPTAALPAPVPETAADQPDAGDDVANVSPEVEPQGGAGSPAPEEPSAVESPAQEKARPAKIAPRVSKKPVVQRSRAAKPAVARAAKRDGKITPFNGALSGLFSPGAPSSNRRR